MFIYVYNQKKKEIIKESIPSKVIWKNKIYDYVKLCKIVNKIVYKYKLMNTFFKTRFYILLFEKITPAEEYLFNRLFNFISNVSLSFVYVNNLFNRGNHIFISGNILYYKNKVLKKLLEKKEYILIGNSDLKIYEKYKEYLIKKYKMQILTYENSNMIIYESI